MTDLLGAASRIDDAARALDQVFVTAGAGIGSARNATITQVMSDTGTQLAAAMPNGLGTELRSFYIPYDADVETLSKVRSQLAHLGAVTRAVHELGGVDHVASQGGLDAIDGAADVVRRHLLLDAADQLRSVGSIVDERPFGVSMSSKARTQHVNQVRRAVVAPITQLTESGLLDDSGTALVDRLKAADHEVSRDAYEQALRATTSLVDRMTSANPATLPAPTAAWTERALVSNRARAIVAEHAARTGLPTAPRLTTLADDASVLANAGAAIDQHAATFDAMRVAIGDTTYYSNEFRAVVDGSRGKLDRAAEDVLRIKQLLGDAPDALRDVGFEADHWVSYNARYANRGTRNGSVDSAMVTNAIRYLDELKQQLTTVVDEPELLHAGSDVADEVREVLARPGARMDLAVLRDLLDGDTATRARSALVEHVTATKPHAPGSPRTKDVQEALQLLDEAELIGTALKDQAAKSRYVPVERALTEPALAGVVSQMLERADTALGTSALVSEGTSNSLAYAVSSLRKKFGENIEAWQSPRVHDVEASLDSIRAYRSELATGAERGSIDGGLRAISPSARPAQALEARSRWILRELDALKAPGADATSADRIEEAARRATIVHDLLRVADSSPAGPARQALTERAITEYQSLGETWRMPDDVAQSLWNFRDEIQRTGTIDLGRQLHTGLPGYNTNPGMIGAHDIASGLQSWAMFTDGPLPETAADRLAVAARRGAGVRSYFDAMVEAHGTKLDGVGFGAQIEELRRRVGAVDDIAGDAVPASVREGVEQVYATMNAELERRAAASAKFEKPGKIPDAVWDGRAQLDTWIEALDEAHRSARAAASERVSW